MLIFLDACNFQYIYDHFNIFTYINYVNYETDGD